MNFSKLTHNNQIFRNEFVCSQNHFSKISVQNFNLAYAPLYINPLWSDRMACMDAQLTISHLQKSLDTGMEFYIVQLNISTAFDRVSHGGLLFKLKCIGVSGSVLSICREFCSLETIYASPEANSWQRAVVDGATNEWIPIVSGMPQGSVLGPLLFIHYTSELFEPVKNRLYGYAEIPHYEQLFASQQTDLLLLPSLKGTLLVFRSGAITGARY